MEKKYKVGIVCAGSFGTAMAITISKGLLNRPFNSCLSLWLRDEIENNVNLADLINNSRENSKYLPGISLPENIFALTDKTKIKEWDIVIFSIPHEYFCNVCDDLEVKEDSLLVSLTKGFVNEELLTPTFYLEEKFKRPTFTLMGANIAKELAQLLPAEATLSYKLGNEKYLAILKQLFTTNNFNITTFPSNLAVEYCGALKNIIAIVYGISEKLNLGCNFSSAIFRKGILEIQQFLILHNLDPLVIFEPCGISDLFVTCLSGRNRIFGHNLVDNIECKDTQGVLTCKVVYNFIMKSAEMKQFSLINALYNILEGSKDFEKELRNVLYERI